MHDPSRLRTPSSNPSRLWFGSWVAISCAKTATRMRKTRMIRPTTADRCRRTSRSVSRHRLAGRVVASGSAASGSRGVIDRPGSPETDPRIEEPYETSTMRLTRRYVTAISERHALDDDVVAPGDRLEHRPSDARQVEDRSRSGWPRTGRRRVCSPMTVTTGSSALRSSVTEHDGALLEALRAGRPDVVQTEDLEQARAGHPGDDRQRDGADGDGRQDEVPDGVDQGAPLAGDQGVEDVHVRDRKSSMARGGP